MLFIFQHLLYATQVDSNFLFMQTKRRRAPNDKWPVSRAFTHIALCSVYAHESLQIKGTKPNHMYTLGYFMNLLCRLCRRVRARDRLTSLRIDSVEVYFVWPLHLPWHAWSFSQCIRCQLILFGCALSSCLVEFGVFS